MGGGGDGNWNRLGDVRSLEEKAKAALAGGKRNVFISFATEDMAEVNLLRGQAKNEHSDIDFNDHSVREPIDSDRAEYIKSKITERINRCSVTVVYVSKSTSQSDWVKWEVKKSLSLGKRVIVTHAGAIPASAIPKWLSGPEIKIVPWSKLTSELK